MKYVLFSWWIAVVLLDTTKEDSLDWTRYPFGPQSATPGVSLDEPFYDILLVFY